MTPDQDAVNQTINLPPVCRVTFVESGTLDDLASQQAVRPTESLAQSGV